MQRKERDKTISSKLRASDQALAEGQSTKVSCQELARESPDRSTRDANENSERKKQPKWRTAGREDAGQQ